MHVFKVNLIEAERRGTVNVRFNSSGPVEGRMIRSLINLCEEIKICLNFLGRLLY